MQQLVNTRLNSLCKRFHSESINGSLNCSFDAHPWRSSIKHRHADIRNLCLVIRKRLTGGQDPYAIQALVAVLAHYTLHSSQLILPHAAMSSRWDRTKALAFHVSPQLRLLAAFKLAKSTTNAASKTPKHKTFCTPSTNNSPLVTPNEAGSFRACSLTLYERSLGLANASRSPRRRSSHAQSSTTPTGQCLEGNQHESSWQRAFAMRPMHSKSAREVTNVCRK